MHSLGPVLRWGPGPGLREGSGCGVMGESLIVGDGGTGMSVPALFLAAAAWTEGRAFGDPAGMAVRALLSTLTGPPRIGVCTLDVPVQVVIPGARMVRVVWPAVGSGADVVVLIHRGAVSGRVRSRMHWGPQGFRRVPDRASAERVEVGTAELLGVRTRLLHGELRALAVRFPEVSVLLPDTVAPGPPVLRVAVIGPDPALVAEVRAGLAGRMSVLDSAEVDVVVAVAGGPGFTLDDAPVLRDAWQRVGRLVVTAPVPPGVCPAAVPAGPDLAETVRVVAGRPAGAELPAVPEPRWRQVVERLERRTGEEVRQVRVRGDRAALRRMAGGEVPAEPGPPRVALLVAASAVVATAVLRPELVPVVAAAGVVQLLGVRRRALGDWWEAASRSAVVDRTGAGVGPRAWLRGMWLRSEQSG